MSVQKRLAYEQALLNSINTSPTALRELKETTKLLPKTITYEVCVRTLAYQLGKCGPYAVDLFELDVFKNLEELPRKLVELDFRDGISEWEADSFSTAYSDWNSMSEDIKDKRVANHTSDICEEEEQERWLNNDIR